MLPPRIKQWQLRVSACLERAWGPSWDKYDEPNQKYFYQHTLERNLARWIHLPANTVSICALRLSL